MVNIVYVLGFILTVMFLTGIIKIEAKMLNRRERKEKGLLIINGKRIL
jgi:hypothetical protein